MAAVLEQLRAVHGDDSQSAVIAHRRLLMLITLSCGADRVKQDLRQL
ncbi:MAG: hypothetical protein IH983_00230 [Planctomycetes bacterium]|nr:hypothetical protein [Planctomycetota bacterium]